MADLDEFEQATADAMAARFVADQGVDPERAVKMARALVLQATAAGELMSLADDERSGGQDGE